MDEVQITIIGGGVIGLAIAARLSAHYDNIVLLEQNCRFGMETSSRNSEVVHSGIYYRPGSLKASLCLKGAKMLYSTCKEFSVPYKKIGKLIVAQNQNERKFLEVLFKNGIKNGVNGLKIIDKKDIQALEPDVNAISAIYSPNTGIIDSHRLMQLFISQAESNQVMLAYNSKVISLEKRNKGFIIGIEQGGYKFKSKIVINSAGLFADKIASLAGIDVVKNNYRLFYCKGSYFSYGKRSPISMLVYPVPQKRLAGLGVHATLDLGKRLRFGPDTEYVDRLDYKVDKKKLNSFYNSVAGVIKGLEKETFAPDMAGIRPKLSGPEEKARDFIINEETDKGLRGLINLIGIESPGLTSSPAIALKVERMVKDLCL
ncbi:MAG: NAD(P)/FAD-dependent oxidoreductase [Desulfosarcina sp.]|nr:NAD(P)/FAD-dependent oxidoreductase [Desulfobacterales bacterium]